MGEVKGRGHTISPASIRSISFVFYANRPNHSYCMTQIMFYHKLKKHLSKNKANLRDLIAAAGLVILLELNSNRPFSSIIFKFNEWPCKTIRHLFYAMSSFVHYFKAIREFKLELQSGNAQFGSKSTTFFVLCDLEIWFMTLKNNRAHPLCYSKLCASFYSHWWIQNGVRVRKRPNWVKIGDFLSCVTLKFDG